MNAAQEQLFDEALLRVLDRNISQFGLGAAALQVLVGEFGFTPALELVQRRLDYLCDEKIGYVAEVNKKANRANRAWKITADGTDHLRAKGF